MGVKCVVGGQFFDKLNSLKWGQGIAFPIVKIAVLDALLASRPNNIQSGMCKFIAPVALSAEPNKEKRKS